MPFHSIECIPHQKFLQKLSFFPRHLILSRLVEIIREMIFCLPTSLVLLNHTCDPFACKYAGYMSILITRKTYLYDYDLRYAKLYT